MGTWTTRSARCAGGRPASSCPPAAPHPRGDADRARTAGQPARRRGAVVDADARRRARSRPDDDRPPGRDRGTGAAAPRQPARRRVARAAVQPRLGRRRGAAHHGRHRRGRRRAVARRLQRGPAPRRRARLRRGRGLDRDRRGHERDRHRARRACPGAAVLRRALPAQPAPWTCAAARVHDPRTGALLGIVDISGPAATVHPAAVALVGMAVRLAEVDLGGSARPASRRCGRWRPRSCAGCPGPPPSSTGTVGSPRSARRRDVPGRRTRRGRAVHGARHRQLPPGPVPGGWLLRRQEAGRSRRSCGSTCTPGRRTPSSRAAPSGATRYPAARRAARPAHGGGRGRARRLRPQRRGVRRRPPRGGGARRGVAPAPPARRDPAGQALPDRAEHHRAALRPGGRAGLRPRRRSSRSGRVPDAAQDQRRRRRLVEVQPQHRRRRAGRRAPAQRHHDHRDERQRHRPQRRLGQQQRGTPGSSPATSPAAITPAELPARRPSPPALPARSAVATRSRGRAAGRTSRPRPRTRT